MWDRLWDSFVELLMVVFLPLVCSYHTLTTNAFLNISHETATGVEQAANALLSPVQYLFAGRIAKEGSDGSIQFSQRFQYETRFWINTVASVAALPPSLLLGSAAKGLSLLTAQGKQHYAAIQAAWQAKEGQSNLETYRKLGLQLQNASKADFFTSQGYSRNPGAENHLAAEKQALREIAALLNEAQIPWWLDCGSCLGAYRYGGVIPWDCDLDIAVLLPDFENVRRVLNRLDPEKYIVQDWSSRTYPQSFIKVFVRESSTLVDIYHFEILPETREIRYLLSWENCMFSPEWVKIRERRFTSPIAFDAVFPLKKALFDGLEVFIPNDPTRYLQRYYGENLSPAKIYDPVTGRFEKDLSHPYWQRAYAH